MTPPKVIVHTDILLDFLIHAGDDQSALRRAMRKFFCYTTVFNAIEIFSLARTEDERLLIRNSMSAMKILGLNAKNAARYGEWFQKGGSKLQRMNALIAGLALESNLPILTDRPSDFRGMKSLRLVSSRNLHEPVSVGVKDRRQVSNR